MVDVNEPLEEPFVPTDIAPVGREGFGEELDCDRSIRSGSLVDLSCGARADGPLDSDVARYLGTRRQSERTRIGKERRAVLTATIKTVVEAPSALRA
jgi:hypothetical protein